MIMNCFTMVAPPINSVLGRLAAGAITETALITGANGVTTAFTMCPPPANAMGLGPWEAYIKSVQLVIRGYTGTRYQWRQIASSMVSILTTRYRVVFRSEVSVGNG
ncbi:hypothetical protein L596_024032 [Steinernema carpocapsae]|uniref:Uncharacterized protein n=1 Tax=Steinernema carpocapsae TaxID=34508 RepID=A0A4U5MFH6_STECR|nr:hypothetical protein L596_024032 [Steinernema carpocapsae]